MSDNVLNHTFFNAFKKLAEIVNNDYASNITILHQYINFDVLIAHLESLKISLSLIFLYEIRMNYYESKYYNTPGYQLLVIANDTYTSGGVGVNYNFTSIDSPSCNLFKLECREKNVKFTCLCCYRIHAINTTKITNEISEILEEIGEGNVFIIGDFNIDL